MADINEEQLLSELLTGIAREDARVDAPHLEARVMESAFAEAAGVGVTTVRLKADTTYVVRAAAVLVVVFLPVMMWMKPAANNTTGRVTADATSTAVSHAAPASQSARSTPPAATPLTPSPRPARATRRSRPATPARAEAEFVPLMPMTEQELAGPFQLVRVQMPRASLGTLRSPLDQPNELVEADVLLGEDGMARAIRVSTSGSVYPWRPR
jgi:hypothetical protein